MGKLFKTTEKYLDLIFVGLYLFVMIATLLLILVNVFAQMKRAGFDSNWLGFIGSIIGAVATIVAVYLTIRSNKESKKNDMYTELGPYVESVWITMTQGRGQFHQLIQSLQEPFVGAMPDRLRTQKLLQIHSEHLLDPVNRINKFLEEFSSKIPPTISSSARSYMGWLTQVHSHASGLAIIGDVERVQALHELHEYERILKESQEGFANQIERYISGQREILIVPDLD